MTKMFGKEDVKVYFLKRLSKIYAPLANPFLLSKMLLASDREGQIRVDLVVIGIMWYNHCIYLLYILPFKLHYSKIRIQREFSTSRNCNSPWYLTLIAHCITLPFELLTNTPASSCSACSCCSSSSSSSSCVIVVAVRVDVGNSLIHAKSRHRKAIVLGTWYGHRSPPAYWKRGGAKVVNHTFGNHCEDLLVFQKLLQKDLNCCKDSEKTTPLGREYPCVRVSFQYQKKY